MLSAGGGLLAPHWPERAREGPFLASYPCATATSRSAILRIISACVTTARHGAGIGKPHAHGIERLIFLPSSPAILP